MEVSSRGITAYIINRYHDDLKTRLPELLLLSEKALDAHKNANNFPQSLHSHIKEFSDRMIEHMEKEEHILFPMIEAGMNVSIKMPIARMEAEHEEHEKSLENIKSLMNNFKAPDDASPLWKSLYKSLEMLVDEINEHINIENNVLFPKALNSLMP